MIFYSDLNQQDNLRDIKIYDLEAIYQSIDNIINTEKGQRLFLPEFGVDLWQYLFEPMTDVIVFQVYLEIYNALEKWEPRIKLLSDSGFVPNYDTHTIDLSIVFEIRGRTDTKYVYQTDLTFTQKENYYEL